MKLKHLYNEIKLIKQIDIEEVEKLYQKILIEIYKDSDYSIIIDDLIDLASIHIESFLEEVGWGNLNIIFKDLPLHKLSIIYDGLKEIQKKYNIQ